jgi:N-acetylglucosaminyldiphosphoundecaprenol N-acetyl-beta-D-mannosaminyltransferase
MTAAGGPLTNAPQRVDVLGVGVSATNLAQAADLVVDWAARGVQTYVTATSVHGIVESLDDPSLRELHNQAGLVCPDGMPLVWSCKRAGVATSQVRGNDLMTEVCRRAADLGLSCFYYGGNEGVAEELAEELEQRWPGLKTAGTHCPPFRALSADEVAEVAQLINETKPDLVWVGLSTPKQERWMGEFRPLLDAPVLLGVGAAFDFQTGRVKQAPQFLRRLGLEWLFRLGVDPRRLWRRYRTIIPRFVVNIARQPPRAVPADATLLGADGAPHYGA